MLMQTVHVCVCVCVALWACMFDRCQQAVLANGIAVADSMCTNYEL